MTESAEETLQQFKDSFSYGSRTDLTFKFLDRLDPAEAGELLRRILEETGALLDHADPNRLVDLVIGTQAEAYGRRAPADRYHYDDAPFAVPTKPVAEARVALLTSSGHFAAGDDPCPFGVADMTQEEATDRIDDFVKAPPVLSTIPVDTPRDQTLVRHGGYDVRGSRADRNVSFPVDRLRELADSGEIGALHPDAYSFVGAAAQMRILRESAPAWAEMLVEEGVDVLLLVPV
jgi:hypothetical protein